MSLPIKRHSVEWNKNYKRKYEKWYNKYGKCSIKLKEVFFKLEIALQCAALSSTNLKMCNFQLYENMEIQLERFNINFCVHVWC